MTPEHPTPATTATDAGQPGDPGTPVRAPGASPRADRDPAPVLELESVVKRYGSGHTEIRALTDVTVRVAPGELVAIMGPSGCGKSTLLHLAGGLEEPDAGRVRVAGRDVAAMGATERSGLRRRDVGYVFQRLNLVPSLSALENVVLPLELEGVARRTARELAREALASVGITERVERYPDDLSGGQQQRVAVARGVVGDRRLLLADEPTGSLDTMTGDAVVDLIADLPATAGAAVVLVTHEPRFAACADRVVFLRDGRIVDETGEGPDPAGPGASTSRDPGGPDAPGRAGDSGGRDVVGGMPAPDRRPAPTPRSPGPSAGHRTGESPVVRL